MKTHPIILCSCFISHFLFYGCSCENQGLEGDGSEEQELHPDSEDVSPEDPGIEEASPPECGDGRVDEGEQCDDGANGDPDDGCTDRCAFSCTGDSECGASHDCAGSRCDPELHRCVLDMLPAGTVCRPAAAFCDAVEVCTGDSPDCPEDEMLPENRCWLQVSAGGMHACAVSSDHGLYCWGWNLVGQLGDGTAWQLAPAPVGR
jgi:cysteine-rich repeat protein